jgi:sugar transferase (PEP-CTERM system associated)
MSTLLLRRLRAGPTALVTCESVLLLGVVAGVAYLRLGPDAATTLRTNEALAKILLITGVCQISIYYADLYDLRTVVNRAELVLRSLRALGISALLLALIYAFAPAMILGEGIFLVSTLVLLVAIIGWRIVFEWVTRFAGTRERLLLVGSGAGAMKLAHELLDRRDLGVDVVGLVDEDDHIASIPGVPVLGSIADIPAIVRARSVDRVVVSLADARGRLPMDKLLEMRLDGVEFDHLASVYEAYTGKIAVENLRPSWFVFRSGFRKSRRLRTTKRLIDITVASIGFVLAMPLMVLVAIAVRLSSPGPVFYRQRRVGLDGRVFTINKFRSMWSNAEATTGAMWAKPNDTRVTRVGLFLRRTRLDELPQLWNVLVGDMSFVGPRPERPEFVTTLTQQIPFYRQRHVVRPGLTGWAQVRYSYGASVEDALEKLQYDLYYIKHFSIAFDLVVILATIKTVLLQRGAQ